MQKGAVQILPLAIGAIIIAGLVVFFLSQKQPQPSPQTQTKTEQATKSAITPTTTTGKTSSSAKGVVQVSTPAPGQEITSPLTITGLVYGNRGKLTIRLKQKESGVYVTEDKTVTISGVSDKINFAEAIQFGLPVQPQPGILEVIYKDESGKGLDDKVSVEVNFPSDLGKGE